MNACKLHLSSACVLAVGLFSPQPGAPVDQDELAGRLRSSDVAERHLALSQVEAMGAKNVGPGLRGILIDLLAREAEAHRRHHHARHRGLPVEPLQDPEFVLAVARIVVELRDPRAIPALAAALFTGTVVPRALADFGEEAAPAVLRVVSAADAWHDEVDGGLIALRLMVEGRDQHPLSAPIVSAIRATARQRLTGSQYFTTLWWAIDLAAALEDPELMAIVTALAHDTKEVMARGVTDPELVRRTQELARDRLAGFPPLPRR